MRSTRWFSRCRSVAPFAGSVVLLGTACARSRPAVPTPSSATSGPATEGTPRTATTMESANTLDESQFGQQPVNRVEELFIGRFPGVQVYNVNGQVQVRIRGAASISASTEPLILIDGQQMTPGSGGLIGLNPRDIHKIEVLKDAVSMAEFGVRGSNGVIKITTKRPH